MRRFFVLATVCILVVVMGFIVATVAIAGHNTVVVQIPVCEEDEGYLRGRGDFDGLRWDRYKCIHNEVVEGR